jgi:hypothetical protein
MRLRLMMPMRRRGQCFDEAADSMRPSMQRLTRLKWSIIGAALENFEINKFHRKTFLRS